MRKIRKPAIGARPGTLVIDPSAAKSVMRAFVYDENTIEEHELHSIDDVKKLQGSGRNLWIGANRIVGGAHELRSGIGEDSAVDPIRVIGGQLQHRKPAEARAEGHRPF